MKTVYNVLVNDPTTAEVGKLGEELAARFLKQKGHSIVHRNYSKSWGEIDLVSEKSGTIHFIEVKTFSRETHLQPEDNVHLKKLKRLHRAIETFVEEFHVKGEWQLDVVAVHLGVKDKTARCRHIKNVL